MNSKWYMSALIVALTFLSIVGLQQNSNPNQEIVLQFNNEKVTTSQVQDVISVVKKQLQALGIAGIHVHGQESGKLRITYFSDTDVALVKKTLSIKAELISYISDKNSKKIPKFPTEDTTRSYKLDVYEIQQANHGNVALDGKFVLELNQSKDRFFNPNVYVSSCFNDNYENQILFTVVYKSQTHIALAIETFSHSIPDVRAGPSSNRDMKYF